MPLMDLFTVVKLMQILGRWLPFSSGKVMICFFFIPIIFVIASPFYAGVLIFVSKKLGVCGLQKLKIKIKSEALLLILLTPLCHQEWLLTIDLPDMDSKCLRLPENRNFG